ncbi:HTH domain-containing protein [Palleronia abyssalis]|uniref:HTH HARE-type domain-containing protein n=1 Tax=Palleronia abyssalis TaxID=1501240 RepID=A0A2R8BYA4_9RHOB|nr:HTH domain-containing protein [Palleronia abyssalis]SPJ25056.1 hypothetical protein PAA8504_02899 [Palleronia abyssalis]
MDTYLDIAQTVLQVARRPLNAKAMLDMAYEAGVVPTHLHGQTQHKTLQARLSEDILHHREASAFYRTEPGQFALKSFLDDPAIPQAWKVPFPARRRTRDLKRPHALGVSRSVADTIGNGLALFDNVFGRAEAEDAVASMHPDEMQEHGYCAVWTFSVVRRTDCVLTYRVGRYRDDRDAFANRRSVGFVGALAADDVSLFSDDPLGVVDCATTVLQYDLDLSLASFDSIGKETSASRPAIDGVIAVEGEDGSLEVVVVLSWFCPDWFEPTTRRLSLNEPDWLCSATRPNNIEDFEPWSVRVLDHLMAAEQ